MRYSEYIDFANGTVSLDPMKLQHGLPLPWRSDDKLRLFECRVDVWLFGPAMLMLRRIEDARLPSAWCHAAYGMFAVFLPYFEMIGKFLNPNAASTGTAGQDFNVGFCDVYPAFRPANNNYVDNIPSVSKGVKASPNPDIRKVVEFRDRARNGLFHVGYTKHGLLIHANTSMQDVEEHDGNYLVNVHSMVRTLVNHFPTVMERIRGDTATRNRFFIYFDTMLAS